MSWSCRPPPGPKGPRATGELRGHPPSLQEVSFRGTDLFGPHPVVVLEEPEARIVPLRQDAQEPQGLMPVSRILRCHVGAPHTIARPCTGAMTFLRMVPPLVGRVKALR